MKMTVACHVSSAAWHVAAWRKHHVGIMAAWRKKMIIGVVIVTSIIGDDIGGW